ncbi:MAG: cytochrome c biogenesis protein ResB, partial [Bdellovibrionaceae bacterium]|nr:cytochrome c biogenesis protein ResB [Pseudobdellovibrionaceae bacterium]
MPLFDRIIKFLASLKFAVVIILAIAVISTVGTIYEAIYMEAEIAQKLVYHSIYMYITLGLLCATLIAVMIDRWPWKQHHAGFVLAHIGIIILLIGALMTKEWGIDGTMAFNIGEQKRHVTVKDRDLIVFGSFDGAAMKNIYQSEVEFLTDPPSPDKPYVVQLGQDQLKFVEYYHFAYRDAEILPSDLERDGPAIRFQLENPNVNMTEWLRRESKRDSS